MTKMCYSEFIVAWYYSEFIVTWYFTKVYFLLGSLIKCIFEIIETMWYI